MFVLLDLFTGAGPRALYTPVIGSSTSLFSTETWTQLEAYMSLNDGTK